jgi:hypothetical protein
MSDYEIGYAKTPKHSRFKPGNKFGKGRPKREPAAVANVIDNTMNSPVEYNERGRIKRARPFELTVKTHIRKALQGKLKSMEALLLLRRQAETAGGDAVQRLEITDWLPDYPGQTGADKTREFAAKSKAAPPAWWEAPVEPEDGST